MARSSFKRAFNNVDFPTLGSPTIATGIPFLTAFPVLKESTNDAIVSFISTHNATKVVLSANSTSSSLKSSSNSISDENFNSFSRNVFNDEA